MNDSRLTNRSHRVPMHLTALLLGLLAALSVTSCNKVSQLTGKLKNVGASSHTTVDQMNQEEAKAVIASESKLVMVEFYTDT